MRKYWMEALFANKDQILDGFIGEDGLLIKGKISDFHELLSEYPEDDEGWYFTKKRDRFIAEKEGLSDVVANPQLIWRSDYEIIT